VFISRYLVTVVSSGSTIPVFQLPCHNVFKFRGLNGTGINGAVSEEEKIVAIIKIFLNLRSK
jgi:hypothetical protein